MAVTTIPATSSVISNLLPWWSVKKSNQYRRAQKTMVARMNNRLILFFIGIFFKKKATMEMAAVRLKPVFMKMHFVEKCMLRYVDNLVVQT